MSHNVCAAHRYYDREIMIPNKQHLSVYFSQGDSRLVKIGPKQKFGTNSVETIQTTTHTHSTVDASSKSRRRYFKQKFVRI